MQVAVPARFNPSIISMIHVSLLRLSKHCLIISTPDLHLKILDINTRLRILPSALIGWSVILEQVPKRASQVGILILSVLLSSALDEISSG